MLQCCRLMVEDFFVRGNLLRLDIIHLTDISICFSPTKFLSQFNFDFRENQYWSRIQKANLWWWSLLPTWLAPYILDMPSQMLWRMPLQDGTGMCNHLNKYISSQPALTEVILDPYSQINQVYEMTPKLVWQNARRYKIMMLDLGIFSLMY